MNRDLVFGARKKMMYGNRPVPKPEKRSPYLGSVITPETRREYESKQQEHFKTRYVADVMNRRNHILIQDKEQDVIDEEVLKFNSEQPDEQQLQEMSERFARNQRNKEQKHYRAWLRGDSNYKYLGHSFPVMTQDFINKSNDNVELEQLIKNKVEEANLVEDDRIESTRPE